jgi:hypothetical protein
VSLTDEMEEIEDAVTSNFDYEINQAVVENLRAAPGKVFSRHHAWHFQGKVWFDGGLFHEEVWRHYRPVDDMSAPTVEELRDEVNAKWGAE